MGFLSNPLCGEGGIRTPGTVARTPHFECGPIDHSGTSPFRSREEDLPRSPDPKPLFWDCKYRHIFYFRTFSCGKNHIWLKKRLRRPCFCRFSGIIRTFDFVEDTPARQNAGKFAFAFAGSYLCKRTDPLRACSIFRAGYTGEMPEWSIGPHSKCGVRATVPGVRIPLSPQQRLIINQLQKKRTVLRTQT